MARFVAHASSSRAMSKHAASPDAPMASKADYLRKNGVRLVKPYFFDFKCSVKGRWVGKSMLDVFLLEFPARNRDYWEEAFADGRLRVTSGKAGLHDPLKVGMTMQHYIHRHEPPVLDCVIPILGHTEDLVAVGKPASMPVHVSGQYRKNSVLSILQAEHPDLGRLLPVHRLDKSVSGVLLFARSPKAAEKVRKLIEGSKVQKAYIARVLGQFPEGKVSARAALSWNPQFNHVTAVEDVAAKDGSGGREAKASHTDFERLAIAPDGRTSLVKCWPRTGRTHQIRVHLQWLGHPIANDMQYGGPYQGPRPAYLIPGTAAAERMQSLKQQSPPFQPSKKQRTSQTQVDCQAGLPTQEPDPDSSAPSPGQAVGLSAAAEGVEQQELTSEKEESSLARPQNHDRSCNSSPADSEFGWLEELQVPTELNDFVCLNCPKWIPSGAPVELLPLWLHAAEYSCEDWSFRCPPPSWSEADWLPSGPEGAPGG